MDDGTNNEDDIGNDQGPFTPTEADISVCILWVCGECLHLVAQPERSGGPKEAASLQDRDDVALEVCEVLVVFEVEGMLESVHGKYASDQARVPSSRLLALYWFGLLGDVPEEHTAKRGNGSQGVGASISLDIMPHLGDASLRGRQRGRHGWSGGGRRGGRRERRREGRRRATTAT